MQGCTGTSSPNPTGPTVVTFFPCRDKIASESAETLLQASQESYHRSGFPLSQMGCLRARREPKKPHNIFKDCAFIVSCVQGPGCPLPLSQQVTVQPGFERVSFLVPVQLGSSKTAIYPLELDFLDALPADVKESVRVHVEISWKGGRRHPGCGPTGVRPGPQGQRLLSASGSMQGLSVEGTV